MISDLITKFGAAGCIGFLLGLIVVQVVRPSTQGGTLLIVVISVAVSVAMYALVRWLIPSKSDGDDKKNES